jgi:hypothetical protein
MRSVRLLALAAALVCTAIGCDEKLTDVTGPTPNLQVSFSNIQQNIFNTADSSGRPACVSCHNARFAVFNGGLNLEPASAYSNLVNAPSRDKRGAVRIIPGDPDNSYVIHKLEGGPNIVGVRMPNGGPYLTSGQILVIRQWIKEGAKND